MNKTLEISDFDKGKQAEIQGQVTYSMEPRQYGKSISQFVVVQDETGKQGCNVGLVSMEDKLENGANVHIKGVVDKYPDKKNPNPDGSLPIATSIKGYVVEETVDAESFPYGANVGESYKDEPKEKEVKEKPVLPVETKRRPVELRNPPKTSQKVYTNNDYWKDKFLLDVERQEMQKENNRLIVRECAIKAVTELVVAKALDIENADQYFYFANKIVDYINTNPEAEAEIEEQVTERDLILSGAKTKAEIIAYINNTRAETPYEADAEFYVGLGCQILAHQTKAELIKTAEKFNELLGGK